MFEFLITNEDPKLEMSYVKCGGGFDCYHFGQNNQVSCVFVA